MPCPKGHIDSTITKVIVDDGNETREYYSKCNICGATWTMIGKGKPKETKKPIKETWETFVTGSGGPTFQELEKYNKQREIEEKANLRGLFKYLPKNKGGLKRARTKNNSKRTR